MANIGCYKPADLKPEGSVRVRKRNGLAQTDATKFQGNFSSAATARRTRAVIELAEAIDITVALRLF